MNIREASIVRISSPHYLIEPNLTFFGQDAVINCFNCNGLKEWDVMSARVDDAARVLVTG